VSNDETSDDISSLAGRVASAKRRSAAERRQINDSKYWNFVRAVIFLYVALVAVTAGFVFRSYLSSGDINFVRPGQSAFFDVFVSNPNITI